MNLAQGTSSMVRSTVKSALRRSQLQADLAGRPVAASVAGASVLPSRRHKQYPQTAAPSSSAHRLLATQSFAVPTSTLSRRMPSATKSFHSSSPRAMFIQTESTPNEDSLKFLPGQQVMTSGTAEFLDTRSSLRSPLAKSLFRLEGTKTVFFGPDFVTVTKVSDVPWGTLKPEIYSTLMEHFTAGHPLFVEEGDANASSDTTILDTDSETVAMIKELLDTRVRPAIQEDGGDLEYRGFGEETDGIVRIMLKGSCRGCDSSTVTLKNGVERMLMHYIPEVKGVEQILDPEEEVALDEFAKLEEKLNRDKEHERKREAAMGFSL